MTGLAAAALLMMAAAIPVGPGHDTDGWAGPGWYVSSDAPLQSDLTSRDILFNGPQESRDACQAIYDRLYSPIGICRHFAIKPGVVRE